MKKRVLLFLFPLMCLGQLFIPSKMIYDQERIRNEGTIFKFDTEPVDPTDPFRGSYINLYFAENDFLTPHDTLFIDEGDVYVHIRDSAGFARIKSITSYRPSEGDFIAAKVSYVEANSEEDSLMDRVVISYPFQRFYLEESKAPKAEQYYRDSRTDSTQQTYALVKVLNGEAALLDVMVNEKSIADIVRENNAKLKTN